MKYLYKNVRLHLLQWAGILALGLSILATSCGEGVTHDEKEAEVREDNANTSFDPENDTDQSNANTGQTEMEIDTSSSASYGGTNQSTGRVDTDTSGANNKTNKP